MRKKSYKSLLDVSETIQVVNILRPTEEQPVIVEKEIKLKNKEDYKIVWMQPGIVTKLLTRPRSRFYCENG